MSNKVWVVLPAAGVGARMQADRPKQYLPLVGKTVIEHTLAGLLTHPAVAGVVVAVSSTDPYWQTLGLESERVLRVNGGRERADSVLNGLNYLADECQLAADTRVLVHDAARPCLSHTDLNHLLQRGYDEPHGAILAVPVRDTMKRAQADKQHIAHTEERNGLWHALTPQMARLGVLRDALARALQQGLPVTDEASALEYAGLHPLLVEGDARNIKITRPADLALAAFLLQEASSNK